MGSNQGKRPHHADRGGKVWSRDEKRENRKVMRDQAQRADIDDSLSSNVVDRQREQVIENSSEYPSLGARRKKPSRNWCRRKEGREHRFTFLEKSGLGWFSVYRCDECGKKKYERNR